MTSTSEPKSSNQNRNPATEGLPPLSAACVEAVALRHEYAVSGSSWEYQDWLALKVVELRQRFMQAREHIARLESPDETPVQRCTCDADQSPCDFCDARMTERDAARYRHLREFRAVTLNCAFFGNGQRQRKPAELDAAVDAERESRPTPTTSGDSDA